MSAIHVNSVGVSAGSLTGSPLGDAVFMDPTIPVFAESIDDLPQTWDYSKYGEPMHDKLTGNLLNMPNQNFNEIGNPLARLSLPSGKNNSDKIIANLTAEIGLWDNLKYKFSWGLI